MVGSRPSDTHAQEPGDPFDDEPVVEEASTYMTDQEAEQLCQTFADGLDSGLGYARIFEMLERNGLGSTAVGRLRQAVLEDGDQLGDALTRFGILDPRARKLVYVAERQGKLPETFRHLGETYGRRYERKKRFIFSIIEPLILVALGGIILGNIVSANLVEMVMAENTGEILTDLLIESGIQVGLYASVCFIASVVWLHLPVDFALRDLFARLWMRVPVLSQPNRLYAISRFCRYLKQSISSGFDVYRSLQLAAEASNHPTILNGIEQARSQLKEGASLTDALRGARILPEEVVEHIEIGEQSGRLQERLQFLTDRYDEQSVERFDRQLAACLWLIRYTVVVGVIGTVLYSLLTINI